MRTNCGCAFQLSATCGVKKVLNDCIVGCSSLESFSTVLETAANDADSTQSLSFEDSPVVRIEICPSDKFNDSK